MNTFSPRGFTLIEIMVALAVIMSLATVTLIAFQNMYRAGALTTAQSEVYTAFRDARTKTLASQDSTVYGVMVSSTTVTRFVGDTFSPGELTNVTYFFEAGVFATGTLAQSETPIVFKRLSGVPNATGTILIEQPNLGTFKTVSIHGTGLIE